MSLPGIYSPTMKRGDTFNRIITYKDKNGDPVNLTGWTGKAQVRKEQNGGDLVTEFNTDDPSMVLGGAAGTVTIKKTKVESAAIVESKNFWDVVLNNAALEAKTIVEGVFNVSGRVTE